MEYDMGLGMTLQITLTYFFVFYSFSTSFGILEKIVPNLTFQSMHISTNLYSKICE
jgi:hypothetical protein